MYEKSVLLIIYYWTNWLVKHYRNLAGTGLVAAIASSLCCIIPLISLLAGLGGVATAFSWIEPARPYLIGFTVLALGFAWYLRFRDRITGNECACDDDVKRSFLQGKAFLPVVSVVALLMLSFPNYAHIFYPNNATHADIINEVDVDSATFFISGMTCTGCEEHVEHGVKKLPGIVSVSANYKQRRADVTFDRTRTSIESIEIANNETGYKVTGYQLRINNPTQQYFE